MFCCPVFQFGNAGQEQWWELVCVCLCVCLHLTSRVLFYVRIPGPLVLKINITLTLQLPSSYKTKIRNKTRRLGDAQWVEALTIET